MLKRSSLLIPTAKRLDGKVAVVTDGASGIGESAVRLLLGTALRSSLLISRTTWVVPFVKTGCGEAISFVHCDVTSDTDAENAVDTAVAKYGKLDIMFSNAGIEGTLAPSILGLDLEQAKKVFDVNLFGAFLCAKHAARVMVPAKKGSIIFNSSIAAVTCGLSPLTYTVSKHALVGFAGNLCVELGQHGIRVNCISPYGVFTLLFRRALGITEKEKADELSSTSSPLKGVVSEAEDVAEAVVYFGSNESKYVTGQNLVLDGGYSTTNPAFGEVLKKLQS